MCQANPVLADQQHRGVAALHPDAWTDAVERAKRVVRKNRLCAEFEPGGCGDECSCVDACQEAVGAIAAAIALAFGASPWLPIEAAPKEVAPGESYPPSILAIWPGGIFSTRWDEDTYSPKPKPHWRVVPQGGHSVKHMRDNQPKLWRPLPALPLSPDEERLRDTAHPLGKPSLDTNISSPLEGEVA